MGKAEGNGAPSSKRQEQTSALDARVDSNDKRITILEKAAESASERKKASSEWWRWAVELAVAVI